VVYKISNILSVALRYLRHVPYIPHTVLVPYHQLWKPRLII